MDDHLRRLLRKLASDRDVIQDVRWAYRRSGAPMPNPLLYEYVMFMLSKQPFQEKLIKYIESVLNSESTRVIPERFEGSDASDGIYYSGWEGSFSTNQPMTRFLTDNIGNLSINIEHGYEPQFQWALMCQDSVGPDGPIYSGDFEGGDAFGNLRQLCLELQDNLRQNRGCDQWKVRWSHGQEVTTNITELTDDEWEERLGHLPKNEVEQEIFDNSRLHVDHYSTTHGFFIWITHPINQHMLEQIETETSRIEHRNPEEPTRPEYEYFGSSAAGLLLVRDDGYFLAVLRSSYVNEPHIWGIPGGASHPGERPGETATREATEELGSLPPNLRYVGAVRYQDGSFIYITYIYSVKKEQAEEWSQDIMLNWENDDAAWFPVDKFPEDEPLHFGLKHVLEEGDSLIREAAS